MQELDSLGENPDPDAIAKLPYLTAVCKEALRLYPIALIAQPRQVKESVQIQGYELEPTAIAVPCIYLTHRRQDVYPEPDDNYSVRPWRRGITIVPSEACPMVVKTQRHLHSSKEKVISYQ